MDTLANPWRGVGLPGSAPLPASDPAPVAALLARCPAHRETPLLDVPSFAERAGVSALHLKDERDRMGLGSFKALGAAYVIARDAADAWSGGAWDQTLTDRCYVTASAGNHGLSVAAGARLFGARAIVHLADSVPEAFAARLRSFDAEVVRSGAVYEDAMAAAEHAAQEGAGTLLSDSAWPGYIDVPARVMEGYLQVAAETVSRLEVPPTHVLLQAGVGGFAAAIAAHLRRVWGDAPRIVIVEPAAAPALIESIRAGRTVTTEGPVSCMGRLDCKAPSLVGLAGLARDADLFVTLGAQEALAGRDRLAEAGLETTASGAAGVAALLAGLDEVDGAARILAFLTEGPADDRTARHSGSAAPPTRER